MVFPISPQGEQPDYPSLRASDEHRVIVRVLQAQRTVWLLPLLFSSRTLRKHGNCPSYPASFFMLVPSGMPMQIAISHTCS